MKQFSKLFFAAAVAALGLASCAKEVAQVETPKDNLVTVHFGATAGIEGATKATLTTEDELTFTSAWENEDALSVKYSFDYGTPKETTATWSSDKSCFEAQIGGGNGIWIYDALYPTPKEVSFGSERTQNGNNYNSKYDLMLGSATAEGADAGKTADGKDIVFNMTRQTAIAYFHLTSDLDEEVVSAKLSVEGDGAYLSTSEVKANEDYAKGYTFTKTEGVASKEINLTFTGEAPRSSNFKLWFNVLPTMYTKMTLTVETTNNTLTISRNAPNMDEYVAGKLYKVVKKEIPADKWVKKGGETPKPTAIEDILTSALLAAENTAYKDFSNVKAVSNAIYSGNSATTDKTIQLRTKNNNSGIVTTASGGYAQKIFVVWNNKTLTGRTLNIYGKNTKYTSAADLYDTEKQGSLIGSIKYGETSELTINNDYQYIGIRSDDSALYLDSITITWENAKTALKTPANLQVSAEKVVSWDAVSGAASYEVTIGENSFTSETTSYDAADITDDYYDVSVVAVPSDKDNYNNSAAATINGAKFGTPTLATPTLKKGVIDGASISVSWSVDERATAGYNCELFKGGVKVGESQTVNAGAVTFTGLDAETAYVVKVNAIAVEGAKSYAASPVAILDVTTKAAGSVAAKTYTLTFASSFNDGNVQNYTSTWNATRDGFTWKMVNWNNNNNYNKDWAYVKAGPKGNKNAHAKIETDAAIPEAISKISITIDKIENGSITSIVLKSSTTNDFTSGTTIETKSAVAVGTVVFTIPSPQNNLYYQLDFTLNNTTGKNGKNGVATVSKVVYTNN